MPTDVVDLKRRNKNVTIYVGSDNDSEGHLFCFEKGPHSLVIQTPTLRIPGYIQANLDLDADHQYRKVHFFDLEKISTLVKNIEFGKTNWAFLVTRKDGSYHLHYKEKFLRPILCPPWAAMVPEADILYTKYITADERQGVWNDKKVDCFVGWSDRWRELVDFSMRGHRLLSDLDVTYPILGHIVRDGEIVGLMTEHVTDDRRVEYMDRAAVYAAVTKVQSRRLIISLEDTSIIMHKGKVRLLGTQSVRKFSEVDDPEQTAERFHWQALEEIFAQLRQYPNTIVPLPRCIENTAVPMLPVPAPEKLLDIDVLFRLIGHCTELYLHDEDENPTPRKMCPNTSRFNNPSRPRNRPYFRQHPRLLAL
ncbi:hypothetical protein C8R43DRAFT_1001948 [Mycena crocata]|nr:hypothetical protein C8R43DRAFT_1001948 [Mycena crocata]